MNFCIVVRGFGEFRIHFKGTPMSRNKIALSFALAGILGASTALAETDGAFVGVQLGYGGIKTKNEASLSGGGETQHESLGSESASALRYGFIAGYKQFFTENFGLRYYGVFDYGTDFKVDNAMDMGTETLKFSPKISVLNISANVDALYNFISNDSLEFGAFGGLSLAYANYTAKNALIDTNAIEPAYKDFKFSGFDMGINVGIRAQIAQQHGIELYGRFAFIENKKEETILEDVDAKVTQTFKASQPYQVGLRYTFSF